MTNRFEAGKVSVIIPVYNAGKYIGRALESIFAQTYDNIEIILVDDCSEDNSADIIKDYQQNHPEIVYYLQEKNMGAGAARNKALELAAGQYAAFLDSDDLWLPDKISRQIQLMKSTKTPFSYAAIEMIDENGLIIKGKRNIKEKCDYNYLLKNTIIATSSVVVDRMFFGDFRMSLRRGGQDYATWLKLLRDGIVAQGINEVLVKYRLTPGSLSSNKFKSVKQVWEIQTNDENIGIHYAFINIVCFIFNALKKYLIS